MGKKLAIKGHSTRGKEVIELLEMLGGRDVGVLKGDHDYYVIDECENNLIKFYGHNYIYCHEFVVFTLEEFLEKYPFKIGDKVQVLKSGTVFTIGNMIWDDEVCDIYYYNMDDIEYYNAEELKLYKETDNTKPVTDKCERTREDVIFDSIIWHLRNSVNNGKQNLSGGECEEYFREVVKKNNENKMKSVLAELLEHIKTTPKEELEREFEEIKEWSNVGPTIEEFKAFCECVNKKPKYPTTYEECCEILNICPNGDIVYAGNWFYGGEYLEKHLERIRNFQRLLVCRDAYWKIAGKELGLGKPWESPLPSLFETVYCIRRKNNKIIKGAYRGGKSEILEFPTEEMRDTFYDNFEDLIEQCKELL